MPEAMRQTGPRGCPPRHRRGQRPAPAARRRPRDRGGRSRVGGAPARHPPHPKFAELRFWTGEVLGLTVPRVAVLGTDCALGKRTTATFLLDGLRRRGLRGGARHHRADRLAPGASPRLHPRCDAERFRHRRARARRRRLRARGEAGPDPPRRAVGAAQPERTVRRRAPARRRGGGRRAAARPGTRLLRRLRGARSPHPAGRGRGRPHRAPRRTRPRAGTERREPRRRRARRPRRSAAPDALPAGLPAAPRCRRAAARRPRST